MVYLHCMFLLRGCTDAELHMLAGIGGLGWRQCSVMAAGDEVNQSALILRLQVLGHGSACCGSKLSSSWWTNAPHLASQPG